MCTKHYKRFMKYGDPNVTAYQRRKPGQLCSDEECDRPAVAKGLCTGHYQRLITGKPVAGKLRKRNKPDEFGKVCPACDEYKAFCEYSTQGGRSASWCKVCRTYGRKRNAYGLTREAVDAMISGGCEVCGARERIHIDHDHATGRVRGALCSPCNVSLGYMKDSPERLERLAAYARKHAAITTG